ncbi:ARM repeat-containing protein [Hesseltinella vesiculosa]|uniref:ARM repeat-containing protein n=1 Tax=Hesseltinella vesiculosa TaxID=101127 RepID=A0A1X2GWV1_9FUNG|nr:ARM repeat-containing protein [Hesseltinella vesiculosa]
MAANELLLLEKVELKLAMSSTDDQLQRTVSTFLPPVLLKLASPHEQTRKKVMELLAHINKRVKSNQAIELPFDVLLDQYCDPQISAFVKNFTIIYLDMGMKRFDAEKTASYIPKLLTGISKRPAPHRATLMHMVLPALRQWHMEPADQELARANVFHFDQTPDDATTLLAFFLNVILYQPLTPRQLKEAASEDGSVPIVHYPGLSQNALGDVTNLGKVSWSSASLADAKLGIIHFILSKVFTDNERLPILIAGTSDASHLVISACEDGLRRWTGTVDLENTALVQALYGMYIGTDKGQGKNGRVPCGNPTKIKLLQYLGKSITASNMSSKMIQVVFDGLYGEKSNMRLQRSTMAYLQWCTRMCDESQLTPIAPIIVSGLTKYIRENPQVSGHDAETIKGYAYVACGLIIRKVPKVGLDDMEIVSMFFENLLVEPPNIRVYVQDALSSIIGIFSDLDLASPIHDTIQNTILKAVELNNANTRYMALKYVNGIYPFSLPFGRYVCLLARSSTISKLEILEESKRGLHPFVRVENGISQERVPASALPSFADMVTYLVAHKPGDQYRMASRSPLIAGYPLEVYSDMLAFLRLLLVLEANPEHILIDDYVESKVDHGMSDDPVAMDNVKQLLASFWDQPDSVEHEAFQSWLNLLSHALDPNLKDPLLMSTVAKSLLDMISLGPASITSAFSSKLPLFKTLTTSNKLDTRLWMTRLYGIIASDPIVPQEDIEATLIEYCDIVQNKASKSLAADDTDRRHGAILTIGYLLSRTYYRQRTVSDNVVAQCMTALSQVLDDPARDSAQQLLAGAACHTLADIGRVCSLETLLALPAPPSTANSDVDQIMVPSAVEIISRLSEFAKSSKDAKLQEQALLALGNISITLTNDGVLQQITEVLFSSADSRQVELYFAGGEAWSAFAFGWNSQALQKYKDISTATTFSPSALSSVDWSARSQTFQTVIDTIVKKYVASDRAWYRKASCIWLLSILKFGSGQDIISSNLRVIHASFSRLLSDRDDFTQECASKGLGLVYEYGDAKIKEDMLYSLVGTFTDGQRIQAQSVSDNTILFDEGTLGSSPDGNSITTYKELCSLASELNQPDLIYKFMNLANHNAMWTSRRGAAFGFQNLMAMAEKEMEPYLHRLIPKLYRYQFDPNPQVNQSMKSIWQSLVKDNQKTTDKYFDEIMDDVIKGLGNRQWRVREACCAAVTDLVQGRPLVQVEKYLESLWFMSFRALDDIKGSVRQAATQTCKQLTKLTVHYCDPQVVSLADGAKVMDIVMPFLLQKGIVSDAEDVQKFSLDAVLRVCKTGAALLKKYIPDLVDTLLQSLSSLEPQSMNYLSFHVEQYNISQEQLDNARLTGAKNSPMMQGIEHCVAQIDEEVMTALTPKLLYLVRKGTGLPTKAGTARFIVTLCMNRRTAFEPHADTFLKALSGAIKSKNPVIRKTFATATGYVCQLATYDRLLSLVKHLKKLYVEETDEDCHTASAVTSMEITRFATDRMKSIASEIVPLIYFGEHDPDKDLKKVWAAAWENLTSGTRSMVSLHVEEILQFIQPLLNSASWKVKQTAALTLADMCKSAGKDMEKYVHQLMPVMVSTLATRSWKGKENVLDAFAQLCSSAKAPICSPAHQPPLSDIAMIFIREAKRKNREYQRHALLSLTVFLESFGESIDMQGQVQDFLLDLCEMDEDAAMDDEENDNAKPLLLMVKANSFKALSAGYHPQIFPGQASFTERLCQALTSNLKGNVWNVQLANLQSMAVFVERSSAFNADLSASIIEACLFSLGDLKYTAIRTAALEVFELLCKQRKLSHDCEAGLKKSLQNAIEREPTALLKDRLTKLRQSF